MRPELRPTHRRRRGVAPRSPRRRRQRRAHGAGPRGRATSRAGAATAMGSRRSDSQADTAHATVTTAKAPHFLVALRPGRSCPDPTLSPEVSAVEAAGVGLTVEAAAAVPWLAELLPVPADAAWPRLMSAVPARATGSYGWDAIAVIEEQAGRPLWWGQRLVIVRALEHDADGELVWRRVGLDGAAPAGQVHCRRRGRVVAARSGDLFGEPQEVLHIARDVGAAVNVQRPHRIRAERDPRFKVRAAGGRLERYCLPCFWISASSACGASGAGGFLPNSQARQLMKPLLIQTGQFVAAS